MAIRNEESNPGKDVKPYSHSSFQVYICCVVDSHTHRANSRVNLLPIFPMPVLRFFILASFCCVWC